MAGERRWVAAGHPVAGDEEGPVEATPVVRHEPRIRRNVRCQSGEQAALGRMVWQEELNLAEAIRLPPAEPDEEGDGPGRRGQTGRLRVEADQRNAGRRQARQRPEPLPVDRQDDGRRLDPDDRPGRIEDQLAVERLGQPLPELDRATGDAAVDAIAGRRQRARLDR